MASGTNCVCAWLHQLQSSNNVIDGSLDDDVFFRSRSWQALHPFTNFMNNVVMNAAY